MTVNANLGQLLDQPFCLVQAVKVNDCRGDYKSLIIREAPYLNMKKLSSWYAFTRFQESWYSNMVFLDAQDG